MDIQILLLLLLINQNNKDNEHKPLHSLNNYINSIEIDLMYTEQKVNLLKKIAPLMPGEYIQPLNRSVMITESVIKLLELKNYLDAEDYIIDQNEIIPLKDNRERINRIISVIQKEVPKSNMNNMGMVMNMVVNMDQYKKMFTALNTFMSNQDAMKDPESIIQLMAPLLGTSGDKESSKEIEQMMSIIKLLASSDNKTKKKETPH